MKLRVIVKPTLKLTAEDKVLPYGEEFEVDFERGKEILKATYDGKPVVELVEEAKSNEELEAKVSELEEANKTLAAEKEAAEAKISELEEAIKALNETAKDPEVQDPETKDPEVQDPEVKEESSKKSKK